MLNYIILAHKEPEQVLRLVDRLDFRDTFFYIHIDKKVDITPFYQALNNRPNVIFLNEQDRCIGVWGDMSLVTMALNAMRYIASDDRKGHCILLSGQDYPLRPANEIFEFFSQYGNMNFLSFAPLPYDGWGATKGFDRIEQYKIKVTTERTNNSTMLPTIYKKEFYKRSTISIVRYILFSKKWYKLYKMFIPRRMPAGLQPHGGDAWWAFNMKTVKTLLNIIDKNPSVLRFGTYTKLPDEVIIQSIIATHINKEFIRPAVTYIKWKSHDLLSPELFTSSDSEELNEAAKTHLFARKFETTIDGNILNYIDKRLLKLNTNNND